MPLDPIEITGGIAIGEGVGGAIQAVVEPQLQRLKNDQWAAHAHVPLDAMQAALALIKGIPTSIDLATEATYTGISGDRLGVMEEMLRVYPGTGELLELWRRDRLTKDQVDAALHRQGYSDTYRAAVLELFDVPLDPAIIATAIQRGIMADPGFLPVGPPTAEGSVKAFPVSPLDPVIEAQWSGVTKERLFVETALVGLPLALVEAAQGYFRGILTIDDFKRAVAEGNTRNEWGDAALAVSRQIITAHDGVEARLRGWIDDKGMYEQTSRHGMSKDDTDILFKITGRPLSFHQVFIGERRGGVFDGSTADIDPAFLRSLQESNIRPEWYSLAWAQRYNYPTAFVLRSLTESGDLTEQETHAILLFEGWEPTLAGKVAARWAAQAGTGPAAAKPDPWVAKASNHLWTAVQKGYVGGSVDQTNATISLDLIGVATTAQAEVFARWDETRRIEAL